MGDYQPTSRRPIAELFRRPTRPVVAMCVRWGVHPDAVSYASMASSGAAAVCFWQAAAAPWLLAPAVGFCYLRLWFNMLDGMVALAAGKASLRGEILNELPDRVSDVLIFVGVAHSGLCHPTGGYWVAIFALLVAYVGTFGQAIGVGRQFGGLMAKPWRMVVLHAGAWTALGLLWWANGRIRYGGLTVLDWTHLVIIAGCVETITVRLVRIIRSLRAEEAAGKTLEQSSES